jgi:PAS domain S-box-containing protein
MTSTRPSSFPLFEAAPEAILITDRRGTIVYSNRCAERAFRRTRQALRGTPWLALVAERSRSTACARVEALADEEAQDVHPRRFVARRGDGAEFAAELSVSRLARTSLPESYVVATVHELAPDDSADPAPVHDDPVDLRLEGIPFLAVRLDGHGRIVAVNETWRRMARGNGAQPSLVRGVGQDYLEACRNAQGEPTGQLVYEGITDVIDGGQPFFELIYRGFSPSQSLWFRLGVYRPEDGGPGAIVVHTDVTDYYMANARVNIQATLARAINQRMPMLTACRALAVAISQELDWQYAGIWTLDTRSWTLRCIDSWSKEGCDFKPFDDASHVAALAPGVGLPGRAWHTAKVQWVTDFELEGTNAVGISATGRVMPPSAISQGFHAAMAIPIKCGDDVLAVVELFSLHRWPPEQALMAQLEAAGDQLALWELTERAKESARAAEQEADEARANLQAVLECAPAFVAAIDEHGAVQFVNRSTPQARRYELIGAPWQRVVGPEERPRAEQAIAAVLRDGAPQSYETSRREPDGSIHWYTNYLGPMRSGDRVTGVVVISQDTTSAKLAQAELADAQRLAAVGTLAAGVAHEINTPVQFVSDSIHFLRDATNDVFALVAKLTEVVSELGQLVEGSQAKALVESAREAEDETDLDYVRERVPKAFERSIEGLERVATIVRSMKEFAHPAQKDMAPVDLNRAIAATLVVARNEYKYVANLETAFGDLPQVTCHVNEINQVVLNIVVNAAHAIHDLVKDSGEKGQISVRTLRDGGSAVIQIADTGGGIPHEIRHRIFDPFFTTKEVGRGTGQGLAIAWSTIRDKHKGELSFESELGKGTTFTIRIPIEGARSAEERT